MTWVAILALGLASGTFSGIVGFGASIMLMPALMLVFGPREAVPIMAIAALMTNFSRVVVWWLRAHQRRLSLDRSAGLLLHRPHQGDRIPALQCLAGRNPRAGADRRCHADVGVAV